MFIESTVSFPSLVTAEKFRGKTRYKVVAVCHKDDPQVAKFEEEVTKLYNEEFPKGDGENFAVWKPSKLNPDYVELKVNRNEHLGRPEVCDEDGAPCTVKYGDVCDVEVRIFSVGGKSAKKPSEYPGVMMVLEGVVKLDKESPLELGSSEQPEQKSLLERRNQA